MKKYTLTKNFRFESAHRLSKGYVGKCSNIHGHSWNGHIAVSTEQLDGYDMSIDYAELGKFCKAMEAMLDHKLWVWKEDEVVKNLPQEVELVFFEANPTSETLAKFLFERLTEFFNYVKRESIKIEYVQVEETCTTSCRYGG